MLLNMIHPKHDKGCLALLLNLIELAVLYPLLNKFQFQASTSFPFGLLRTQNQFTLSISILIPAFVTLIPTMFFT